MNILFEISKEHPTLPRNEIFACLKAENISYKSIETNDDVLIISTNADMGLIKKVANRLSHVFYVNELFSICPNSINEIEKHAKKHVIDLQGSVAVRSTNRSKNKNSQEIIDKIADIYTKNNKVNLTKPDNEIRVFITDTRVYVSKKITAIDRNQYEKRKAQFRPYFLPISLHPKIARALVNLSCIKTNETLLDPFCGTGGILLEAGLIGAKVIGSDIEEKMIQGCKKTLDFYKIPDYKLYCVDVGDLTKHIKNVDAVVTDFPYGKATTTKGEKIINLYTRAFESISNVLKKNSCAVIGLSNKEMINVGEDYLSLIETYDFRVHRSLTRYFCVYKN